MYSTILLLHSWGRWLVLASLLAALYRAYQGWLGHHPFETLDDTLRHTTATLSHVQLLLGYWLYFISPLVVGFHLRTQEQPTEAWFFGLLHVAVMTVAITVLTLGSALAKRRGTAQAKFRTMAGWFTLALLLLLLAVPWPGSPLAQRPLFRL